MTVDEYAKKITELVTQDVMAERDRCAKIARENYLVTSNGEDCGKHIAMLIHNQ